jgi:protein-tyrosine phosphatase
MRELIEERLWIGNAMDMRDVTGDLSLGITAIIDLAMEELPTVFPRDIVYCRFPLIDGAGNSAATLRAAIQTTVAMITAKVPTLVACGAGMSRAPTIVAAAMASIEGKSMAEVLHRLTDGQPHDVSPGLLEDIKRLTA